MYEAFLSTGSHRSADSRYLLRLETLDATSYWLNSALLFNTVWLIYAGDRLLDCRRLDFSRPVPQRHRFVNRYAKPLWASWCVVLIATIGLSTLCSRVTLMAGGALLVVVGGYMVAAHGRRSVQRLLPKEFIVGSIFAVGCGMSVLLNRLSSEAMLTITMLAGLFTINCLCLARAEQASDRQQAIGSAIGLLPKLGDFLVALAIIQVLVDAWLLHVLVLPPIAAVPMMCSGIALVGVAWQIDRDVRHRGWSTRGPLADWALLSPWLIVVAIP